MGIIYNVGKDKIPNDLRKVIEADKRFVWTVYQYNARPKTGAAVSMEPSGRVVCSSLSGYLRLAISWGHPIGVSYPPLLHAWYVHNVMSEEDIKRTTTFCAEKKTDMHPVWKKVSELRAKCYNP